MNDSGLDQLIQRITFQILVDMSRNLKSGDAASASPPPAAPAEKSAIFLNTSLRHSTQSMEDGGGDGMRAPHSVVDELYSDGCPSEDGDSEEDDQYQNNPWGTLDGSSKKEGHPVPKEKHQIVFLPGHPHDKMKSVGLVKICLLGSRQSGKTKLAKYFLGDKASTLYPHRTGIFDLYTYSLNYTVKTPDGPIGRQVFVHIYDAQSGQAVDLVKDAMVFYLSPAGRIEAAHNEVVGKYNTQLVHTMIDRPHNTTKGDGKWFCVSVDADKGVKALLYKVVGEKLGLDVKTRFGEVVPYGMSTPPNRKEDKPLPKDSPWARGEKLADKERHRKQRDDPTASAVKMSIPRTIGSTKERSEKVKADPINMRRHNPNNSPAWSDELRARK